MRRKYWKKMIIRRLSGELTAQEDSALNNWLSLNPENKRLFEQIESIWIHSGRLEFAYQSDADESWRKLERRMAVKESSFQRNRRLWFLYISAAAFISAAVLSFLYLKYYQQQPAQIAAKPEYVNVITTDSIKVLFLPDSSKVILNAHSLLSYAKEFRDSTRACDLTGEAFFEVERSGRPFIVHAGGALVKVLGTAFNVKADEGNKVEVVVAEGKVSFKGEAENQDDEIILEQDETIIYNKKSKSFKKSKTDSRKLWWNENKLEKDINRLIRKIRKKIK